MASGRGENRGERRAARLRALGPPRRPPQRHVGSQLPDGKRREAPLGRRSGHTTRRKDSKPSKRNTENSWPATRAHRKQVVER